MCYNSTVVCDVTPCSLVQVYWCFGGMCYLYLEGQRISRASKVLTVLRSSQTLLNFYQTIRCHIAEDSIIQSHRHDNFKSWPKTWVCLSHTLKLIRKDWLTI
jgi:hypothetical protein